MAWDTVSVAALTRTQGFLISGVDVGSNFGIDVNWAGDVNHDGIDDLVIATRPAPQHPNRTYVVYGDDDLFAEIDDPVDATPNMNSINVNTNDPNDLNSNLPENQVAGVGDVNGDGIDDFFTGKPNDNASGTNPAIDGGRAILTLGEDSGFDGLLTNPRDLTIEVRRHGGDNQSNAGLGAEIAGGDVNGDGINDIILGCPGGSLGSLGNTFGDAAGLTVLYGRAGIEDLDDPLGPFRVDDIADGEGFLFGQESSGGNAQFGRTVDFLGDVNGDGYGDIGVTGNGGEASYIVFGRADFDSRIYADAGEYATRVEATLSGQGVARIAAAGDFNGDGIEDLVAHFGIPPANGPTQPSFYVVYGQDGGNLANHGSQARLILDRLDPEDGFRIDFADPSTRFLQATVDGVGDFNGDGIDDIAIGTWDGSTTGRVTVVYGRDGTQSAPLTVTASGIDESEGKTFVGTEVGGRFGFSVAGIGDINNDGAADIAVGAPRNDGAVGDNAGEAYVLFGEVPVVPGILVEGGSSRDYLTGTAGNDTIRGNAGHDFVTGLAGDDLILGNAGNDVLSGGEGSDRYEVSGTGDGFDRYFDGGTSGTDVIAATEDGTRIGLYGTFGPDSGIEAIDAEGHSGVYIQGTGSRDFLDFSATTLTGITRIDGAGGHDFVTGSAAADTIVGNAGNDVLSGGEGGDRYEVSGTGDGFDRYGDAGISGTDVVAATADGTRIGLYGTFGPDSGIEAIDAEGHSGVYIQGTASRDVLDFSATTLTGITRIDGAGGHDIVTGSAAADTIVGNVGNDHLTGGGGADRFVYEAVFGGFGSDVIADFETGSDALDFVALGLSAFWFDSDANGVVDEADDNVALNAGRLQLDAAGHGTVSLVGVTQLQTADLLL